jgi:L,D-transpeptidase YcbB
VRPYLFIFPISLFILSCTNATKPSVTEKLLPSALPFAFEKDALSHLELNARVSVLNFYEMNQWKMVWMDSFAIKPDADSLIDFIEKIESAGLIRQDYHFNKLSELTQSDFNHNNSVVIDALLTDSFFALWYHLKNGRVHPKTYSRINIDSINLTDAMDALKQALANHSVKDVLWEREPKLPVYAALKNSLSKVLSQQQDDTLVMKKRNQLVATLERWRLEPKLPSRFIAVNVPSFNLKVVEDDSTILESRVIIGKPETPTPNIKSVVQSFIIYPYWHVPRSILKEILPSVQADTNYLRKHNYQVIDGRGRVVKNSTIDFKKYTPEDFPYVLRQREGAENTMGVIKFVFPNNYGVYLHDTNARRLFSKTDRALSHGCIRVQKAVELAKYLAKDDDTYVDAADLEQYLMVQKRLEVKIVKPIPVHLNYFTVEQQGDSVVTYNDVYKLDQALIDSLRIKSKSSTEISNNKNF